MQYSKQCEYCGKPFSSNRRDSKYCSPACRKSAALERQRNRRKPQESEESAVIPEIPADLSLKATISRQIAEYGLSGHWRAAEAIALADAMDKPDTGAAKASLSRQLTALMEKLEALSMRDDDGVDEVMKHADELRGGA